MDWRRAIGVIQAIRRTKIGSEVFMNDIAVMTHEQAVRSQAVERYVLGELSEEQRAAFESHYFDCPACFEQIKLSGEFLRHAHEVLDPEPEPGFLSAGLL